MASVYCLKTGMEVHYRKFEPADTGTCVSLLRRSFKPPPDRLKFRLWAEEATIYRPDNFIATARQRDYHVAEVGKCVVGLVGIERFGLAAWQVEQLEWAAKAGVEVTVTQPPVAEVRDLTVAAEFQRKQLGRFLLIAAMLKKIDEGVQHFHAYPPPGALPLFEYAGFEQKGKPLESAWWGTATPHYMHIGAGKPAMLANALERLGEKVAGAPAYS